MFNKALVKIVTILAALSVVLTATLFVYGTGEPPVGDVPVVSPPGGNLTTPETPDTETPDTETPDTETPDTETPDPETPDTETPDTETPDTETPDTETPDTEEPTPEKPTPETSTPEKPTTEKPTTEKPTPEKPTPEATVDEDTKESDKASNTSSKKKKPSKDKGTSSKKQNNDNDNDNQTQSQVTSYYTPSYDAGSMSDTWEGEETELEETSSVRELSKHLTNPKKELLKWIWLPILIALICIGALVYINVYVYGGKHNALARRTSSNNDGDEFMYIDVDDGVHPDNEEEEYLPKEKTDEDDDPFSVDNFFHFDNE